MWVIYGLTTFLSSVEGWVRRKTALIEREIVFTKALRTQILEEEFNVNAVESEGLAQFYDELALVSLTLPAAIKDDFDAAMRDVIDFLCVCEEVGGEIVQHLMVGIMLARNSYYGISNYFPMESAAFVMKKSRSILRMEIEKASTCEDLARWADESFGFVLDILEDGIVADPEKFGRIILQEAR